MFLAISRKYISRFLWGSPSAEYRDRLQVALHRFSYVLMLAFFMSAIATFYAFSERGPLSAQPETLIWLLNLDLIILMLLGVVLGRRVISLWSGRSRGINGSHLQVRLVYLFSLMAAVPAILMTVFSALFFNHGIQAWFNERVQAAVDNSSLVAQSYLEEHKQSIAADAKLMASNIINWQAISHISHDEDNLTRHIDKLSFLRNLPEAVVFSTEGGILGQSSLSHSQSAQALPTYALKSASEGELVLITSKDGERVNALVRLTPDGNQYLYAGRQIDPEVIKHLALAKRASEDYTQLLKRSSSVQITVFMLFSAVALMFLLCAIWLGLVLARQLVLPIKSFISATDSIRGGDFTKRLPESTSSQEFDALAQGFNKMIEQIHAQQDELLSANNLLDERRRLTESVLKGVSSGVIGIDGNGEVNLVNRAALNLLDIDADCIADKTIGDICVDVSTLLDDAYGTPEKSLHQKTISYRSETRGMRSYELRAVVERNEQVILGSVVTIEDITEIQKAQKHAAWSDVARSVAHEIKNPLTPIQLSAERLQRKFKPDDKKQLAVFMQCTDVIIQNVEGIGRMVNEFSDFARIPEAHFVKNQNLETIIKDCIFMVRQQFPKIEFSYKKHENCGDMLLTIDPQQIRQVFINLLQNAGDAIEPSVEGSVYILARKLSNQSWVICLHDSGEGLPLDVNQDQLLEPYTTFKKGGTGLGLAIVKKIMDDHGAIIRLDEQVSALKEFDIKPLSGALISLEFTARDQGEG